VSDHIFLCALLPKAQWVASLSHQQVHSEQRIDWNGQLSAFRFVTILRQSVPQLGVETDIKFVGRKAREGSSSRFGTNGEKNDFRDGLKIGTQLSSNGF